MSSLTKMDTTIQELDDQVKAFSELKNTYDKVVLASQNYIQEAKGITTEINNLTETSRQFQTETANRINGLITTHTTFQDNATKNFEKSITKIQGNLSTDFDALKTRQEELHNALEKALTDANDVFKTQITDDITALQTNLGNQIIALSTANNAFKTQITDDITALQTNLTNQILALADANNAFKTQITDDITALQTNLGNQILALSNANNAFKTQITDDIAALTTANKQFYTDLEGTIRIKLEEHRSEIKRFIEEERRILTTDLQAHIERQINPLAVSQKQNRLITIGFGIVTIILLGVITILVSR